MQVLGLSHVSLVRALPSLHPALLTQAGVQGVFTHAAAQVLGLEHESVVRTLPSSQLLLLTQTGVHVV